MVLYFLGDSIFNCYPLCAACSWTLWAISTIFFSLRTIHGHICFFVFLCRFRYFQGLRGNLCVIVLQLMLYISVKLLLSCIFLLICFVDFLWFSFGLNNSLCRYKKICKNATLFYSVKTSVLFLTCRKQ